MAALEEAVAHLVLRRLRLLLNVPTELIISSRVHTTRLNEEQR